MANKFKQIFHYSGSFVVGALALCVFSIPQKAVLGANPYAFHGYVVPVLFGGVVGVLLAMANARTRRENVKLKENNESFLALLNATTESIFLIDIHGNFVAINEVGASRLDRKVEDLIGRCAFDLIPASLRLSRKEVMAEIIASGQAVRHTDERKGMLLDNNIFPVLDAHGEVTHLAVFSRDITRQKKVEKKLSESENRFRGLVESSSDWIWSINEEGVYTYVSPKIRDYLGYEPEEVIGKTPFDLMPEEEAERVRDIFSEFVAAGKPFTSIPNENMTRDGGSVVFETSGVPIFDANGKLTGYQGIDRDITERRIMEMQREKLIAKLQKALAEIKELQGFLPICAKCKKIRDDEGYWQQIEKYIQDRTNAKFSHGLCPHCAEKLYPEIYETMSNKKDSQEEDSDLR